jgi:hypothetical protein
MRVPQKYIFGREVKNVIECYNKLFEKLCNEPDSPRTITFIVEKVFSGKQYTNAEFAFVVAICKTLLNPNMIDSLLLKEKTMNSKVKYYLVSLRFCNIQINKYLLRSLNLKGKD